MNSICNCAACTSKRDEDKKEWDSRPEILFSDKDKRKIREIFKQLEQ